MDRIDFHLVVDSILDAIITIDEKGDIFYCNTAFCNMFEWESKDIIGQPILCIIPEQFREGHTQGFNRYLASGHKTLNWNAIEMLGLKKGGETFPIEISFGEYRSNKGGRYFSGLIKDLSDKHVLKKQLQEADLRYKFFLNSSNEGIWCIGMDEPVSTKLPAEEQIRLFYERGVLKECNNSMAKTYGYNNSDELIGAKLSDLMPLNEDNKAYLQAFIDSGYYLVDAPSTEVSKDGKTLHILNTLIGEVKDEYISTAWGVQRDITELVDKQHALEIVNDELEHFAYSVSHDIQDPTRLIYSYAELLLKKDNLSDAEKKMLTSIYDTARRMESFTVALLKHAQTGKPANPKVISSEEALKIVIQNLEYQIEESGAIIEYAELLNVDIDGINLVQVFQNLISNSIKYRHPDRIPKIYITSKLLYNYVQFSISDNGIGIKAEQKDILFNMYQRLPAKGQYKSGVGLAIVRKILNTYGGRINITSEENQGTNVYFTLPKGNI